VQAIKSAGGTVIAQDEPSSLNFSMPRGAIATGCVDFVLPPAEIAGKLLALSRSSQSNG
jgi:chemotaxis response regulator CheB